MTTPLSSIQRPLADSLDYVPRVLNFGTSGRRGDVIDLTQLEIYLNARAELDYLLHQPRPNGGIQQGDTFYYAHDLRPSSTRFAASQGDRGELAQAIEQAIRDAGLQPVNLGAIPTPALTAYAIARSSGSMMVTGSHIPFDRNGYKTNSAIGELLKSDEGPIAEYVQRWRARLYAMPCGESLFDTHGRFKTGSRACTPIDDAGRRHYIARYVNFFGTGALRGIRVLVYQHSAVGRDLLVEVLRELSVDAQPCGRSETFVPIDTEAIDDATLENIRTMAAEASARGERFDAVVSTDGDSDRPLLIGLDYEHSGQCHARFYGGDLVGMLVAGYLGANSVVVPISCNDAIDLSPLAAALEPKTRIGSPYVIAGMITARERGASRICGWEANGGFLTGSDFTHDGSVLTALPTRDAFLPILCVLAQMAASPRRTMANLFATLPRRYSRAGLIRECPRSVSHKIIESFANSSQATPQHVGQYFDEYAGFDALERIDMTDGVRMYFANGDVAHIRPSGNADELRIYAVAESQQRADEIVNEAVAVPDGILRRLIARFS